MRAAARKERFNSSGTRHCFSLFPRSHLLLTLLHLTHLASRSLQSSLIQPPSIPFFQSPACPTHSHTHTSPLFHPKLKHPSLTHPPTGSVCPLSLSCHCVCPTLVYGKCVELCLSCSNVCVPVCVCRCVARMFPFVFVCLFVGVFVFVCLPLCGVEFALQQASPFEGRH